MPGEGSITELCMYSGAISTRPPILITTAISAPISAIFFSTISCFMRMRSMTGGGGEHRYVDWLRVAHRAPHVVGHDQHAGQEQQAAEQSDAVVRIRCLE